MADERYVVVGLARARTEWFAEVSRWSQSGRLPLEFTKCVSAAELRARLDTVGAVSAVLLDAGVSGADRDLVAVSRHSGAAVLVVDDGRPGRDWIALGASAVLPPGFDATILFESLQSAASPVAERTARHDPVAERTHDQLRRLAGGGLRCSRRRHVHRGHGHRAGPGRSR